MLDINLRGEMVYPIAEILKEGRVPFVFATGYGASSIPAAFADVPRWEKPFDEHALARMLPSLLPGGSA